MPSKWRTLDELFDSAEAQDTDVFDSDLEADEDRATVRVMASFDTAGALNLVLRKEGETDQTVKLVDLNASEIAVVDIQVAAGYTFNFQHGGTTPTAEVLLVQESITGAV